MQTFDKEMNKYLWQRRWLFPISFASIASLAGGSHVRCPAMRIL